MAESVHSRPKVKDTRYTLYVGRNTFGVANKDDMRKINEIIIHCSATKEGQKVTVADIERWHIERGFRSIGYHFVIYADGSVHVGRRLEEVGAHCTGHNSYSIGVCYIGGLDRNGKAKDTRTDAQKKAMAALLHELCGQFGKVSIVPHNKYANKECPCFDVDKFVKQIGL